MTRWSYHGPKSSDELMYLYVYLESLVNTKYVSTTNAGDHNSRQQIWELVKRAKMEKLYPHGILYVNNASIWNGVFSPLLVVTDPYYYYISILSELQVL